MKLVKIPEESTPKIDLNQYLSGISTSNDEQYQLLKQYTNRTNPILEILENLETSNDEIITPIQKELKPITIAYSSQKPIQFKPQNLTIQYPCGLEQKLNYPNYRLNLPQRKTQNYYL